MGSQAAIVPRAILTLHVLTLEKIQRQILDLAQNLPSCPPAERFGSVGGPKKSFPKHPTREGAMTTQFSFTKYEHEVLPAFRQKINKDLPFRTLSHSSPQAPGKASGENRLQDQDVGGCV